MAAVKDALEALRKAIILDCEESLSNPANTFTEKSQEDDCQCYNNMNVAIRVMNTDPSRTERYLGLIERHILDTRHMLKPCRHKWSTSRMQAAAWELIDARKTT